MTPSSFTTVRPPNAVGTVILADAINASAEVAGVYQDSSGCSVHGFIRDINGNYTVFDHAGLGSVTGLNDSGEVVGIYSDRNGVHSFIYNNGSFTDLSDPAAGTGDTRAAAINASGQVAGTYTDSGGVPHGFIYTNGNFTNFSDPNAGPNGTFAVAINASGEVAGNYFDSGGFEHGFIYNNGQFTDLGQNNDVTGINSAGDVVGTRPGPIGSTDHGFIYRNGQYTEIDDPAAVPNAHGTVTVANGINDADQVTGYYQGTDGDH